MELKDLNDLKPRDLKVFITLLQFSLTKNHDLLISKGVKIKVAKEVGIFTENIIQNEECRQAEISAIREVRLIIRKLEKKRILIKEERGIYKVDSQVLKNFVKIDEGIDEVNRIWFLWINIRNSNKNIYFI